MTKALVATFGFDIDFVVRRMGSEKYDEIILLALKTSEGFDRVEKSYHLLAAMCGSMRIECKLSPIGPRNPVKDIYSTLELVAKRNVHVDLFLTGGPRVLVVSSLIAVLMLPNQLIKRISIIVEGEAFEYRLQMRADLLRNLIALDDRSRAILLTLSQGSMRLSELYSLTKIPKTSMLRRLSDLIDLGIVCKQGGNFRLCDETDEIL